MAADYSTDGTGIEQRTMRPTQLTRQEVEREGKVRIAAFDDVSNWISSKESFVLERNDCSRLHKLHEAMRGGRIVDANVETPNVYVPASEEPLTTQTFLVRHDWASAFDSAEGIGDEVRLPYNTCAFEFRISGRTVIYIASEGENGAIWGSVYIESGDYWIQPSLVPNDHIYWRQVRAICIALDADAATSAVIRAPHKLNEKRAKDGRVPLLDYHVVDLAKRHRVTNPSVGNGGGTKKRLHFRRGHWRHLEGSKTWIRWCLVGDPDLGFIQKHYQL